jgi:hypothetical protein
MRTSTLVPASVLAVMLATACLSGGCASTSRGPDGPPRIAFENATRRMIASMRVQEELPDPTNSARMGQISPLPPGSRHFFERGRDAPPLPKEVVVTWEDAAGNRFKRTIPLARALARAAGTEDEVLVFEVMAPGRIRAYVARLPE